MGILSDMLSAPPPPAYETVARFRSDGFNVDADNDKDGNAGRPGGLDTTTWLTILQHTVRASKNKEREAQGYADLHRNVRFVCKDFYLLSMHLCRARYLQRYLSRVRAPYTSNPYPTGHDVAAAGSTSTTPDAYNAVVAHRSGEGAGRETRILDLFVAASVRSAVEAFESSLLDSTLGDDAEGEKDLFAYHQPKARLEDIVIAQGCRAGLLHSDYHHHLGSDSKRRAASTSASIKAEDLAIELTSRSASLRVRNAQSSSRALRTVLEVPRSRHETLETTARNILCAIQTRQYRQ